MRMLLIAAAVILPVVTIVTMSNIFYPKIIEKNIEYVQNIDMSEYLDLKFFSGVQQGAVEVYDDLILGVRHSYEGTTQVVSNMVENTVGNVSGVYNRSLGEIENTSSVVWGEVKQSSATVSDYIGRKYNNIFQQASAVIDENFSRIANLKNTMAWQKFASNDAYKNDASDADMFATIEPAAGGADDMDIGTETPPADFQYQYDIDDEELFAEAVLVPRSKTVISSSRDGKIQKVHFENGDEFKKGDVILEYYCEDLRAEMSAAHAVHKFAKQKELTTSRLFNMDLSSDLEVAQSKVENTQAMGKAKLVESRIDDCIIRAAYDGRVVKRMANDNEYTRTDRVLMEIASKGTLDVEFLLPSKSLRWVNLDAPVSLKINETDRDYSGKIKQIYGEVDPVSQSIQIRAGLDNYDEPLLPGMSGQITLDIRSIREAGISGFLENKIR